MPYVVIAWPDGGFTERMCSIHETEAEARAEKKRQEGCMKRWRFRVAETVDGYTEESTDAE